MKQSFCTRRGGFSLLEILVVLAIAAFMASLVLGGFSAYQGSQRRATCQANLAQIYRACRLYADDNLAFPPTFSATVGGTALQSGGLGLLWAKQGNASNGSGMVAPDTLLSYLKSPSALHCPADVGTGSVASALDNNNQVDPRWWSYQTDDGGVQTYQPRRVSDPADADFARQLEHRDSNGREIKVPIGSSTIITWCHFHRGGVAGGKPDNVLFYDGSVRRMEIKQSAGCLPGRGDLDTWHRAGTCSLAGQGNTQNSEGAALAR